MSKLRLTESGQVITLTPEEQTKLVEALLNPPKPSPRLRAAFRRYEKIMGKSSK